MSDDQQFPATIAPPAGAEIASLDPDTQKAIYEQRARIIAAKQCPRDEDAAVEDIRRACQRRELAEKYEYNVPGRGRGPSIRLAEELARNWGNFETNTRTLDQDEEKSTVEVSAWDLEKNYRKSETLIVKHVFYSKNGGGRLTNNPDDIYNIISNRASRRLRECIFKNIPGWVKDVAVAECKATLARLCTPEEIKKTVVVFQSFGVTEAQLSGFVGRPSDQFNSDDLSSLRAIWRSIKDGECSVGEAFGSSPGVVASEPTATVVEVKEKKPPKKSKPAMAENTDTPPPSTAETVDVAATATPNGEQDQQAQPISQESVAVAASATADDDPF